MKSILICQYIGIKHSRQLLRCQGEWMSVAVFGLFILIMVEFVIWKEIVMLYDIFWKKLLLLESYTSCEGRIERRRLQTVNAAKYM